MRILHVIQRYWPGTGGAEKHFQEISERLARDGHEVSIYTTDAGDFQCFWDGRKPRLEAREEVHNGVTVRRFPLRHLPLSRWTYPALRRALAMASSLPLPTTGVLFRLARFTPWVPDLEQALATAHGRFDLVAGMTICYESLLEPAWRYARRERIPFLLYPLTHLGESEHSALRRYYTMRHQLALARASDTVFTQTRLESEYLARQGVAPERLVWGGAGVNPDELAGGNAERARARFGLANPVVLVLGTAAYDKGTVHVVEAIRRLWAQGVRADLVLAGAVTDGFARYWAGLSRNGRCIAESGQVHLLGIVDEADKRDLLAAASVLALPSRSDSFGIVFLEAWLYGVPVVGAAAGGPTEVISDGQDGYLVPFGNVDMLAARLGRLLADPALAHRLGEAGRCKVLAQHTWDHVYARVRTRYERRTDPD